ncbi:hypothetical protein PR048_009650 [Dryococelus australis]|uniref:Uncharacterized protein n=1 Tax=Dryococelus australis TaxID=614101 RepID=A0ABQ9I0H2_9NEOP|nr:hypothetical protein PR048_009650 [Dryococelus australis]
MVVEVKRQAFVFRIHLREVQASATNGVQGEQGSIPSEFAPGFSHLGIVPRCVISTMFHRKLAQRPDDAAARRVFSGISHFSYPFVPAVLHNHLASPTSTLKTSGRRKKGDPRENPPTSDLIKHDSHMRKSGSDSAGSQIRAIKSAQFTVNDLYVAIDSNITSHRLQSSLNGIRLSQSIGCTLSRQVWIYAPIRFGSRKCRICILTGSKTHPGTSPTLYNTLHKQHLSDTFTTQTQTSNTRRTPYVNDNKNRRPLCLRRGWQGQGSRTSVHERHIRNEEPARAPWQPEVNLLARSPASNPAVSLTSGPRRDSLFPFGIRHYGPFDKPSPSSSTSRDRSSLPYTRRRIAVRSRCHIDYVNQFQDYHIRFKRYAPTPPITKLSNDIPPYQHLSPVQQSLYYLVIPPNPLSQKPRLSEPPSNPYLFYQNI